MAAPSIRGSTAPVSGLSTTSPAGTQVGDLVVCITWERAGAGSPTHTCQTGSGFVEIRTHAHDDGSTDGRLSCAYKVATSSGANAYAAYTTSGAGTVYTGCIVITADTYEVVTLPKSNSDSGTTNAAPNPPSITSMTGDWLVLAIAGWHLGSAATVAVTNPSNYTETWEIAGSTDVELSLATRALTSLSNATEDPGAFTDDVAPNGTARMTVGIRAPNLLTTTLAAGGTGAVAIAGSTRGVPAGALSVAATGAVSIADATVSGGFTEHFTSLAVSASGSVALAGSTREVSTSLSLASTGSVAIAAATRATTTTLAVGGAGTAALAGATRETRTSLSLAGTGSVVVQSATRETSTSSAMAATGAVTIAGATVGGSGVEHFASMSLSAAASIGVAQSTRETSTSLALSAAGSIGATASMEAFTALSVTCTASAVVALATAMTPGQLSATGRRGRAGPLRSR